MNLLIYMVHNKFVKMHYQHVPMQTYENVGSAFSQICYEPDFPKKKKKTKQIL